MSINHKEYGHFSSETQTAIKKIYQHICALCDKPGRACDHIFPLNAIEYAENFGVTDIHSIENGWYLCEKCHDIKSKAENDAYPYGDKISAVYNRYWKLAFTPKGVRRVKVVTRENVNRQGQRARRNFILQGNRLKVALKNAKTTGNKKAIAEAQEKLDAWRERGYKRYRKAA